MNLNRFKNCNIMVSEIQILRSQDEVVTKRFWICTVTQVTPSSDLQLKKLRLFLICLLIKFLLLSYELRQLKMRRCQFHQRFTYEFFVQMSFRQLFLVAKNSYEKRAQKTLMKLTAARLHFANICRHMPVHIVEMYKN